MKKYAPCKEISDAVFYHYEIDSGAIKISIRISRWTLTAASVLDRLYVGTVFIYFERARTSLG